MISFTGTDWRAIIRGHELATRKGIHISSTPEANANAVSEYTISIILSMTRNLFELNRVGQKKFETTKTLNDLTVGIIGMGVIGKKVTRMLNCLGVKKVIYYSLNKKDNINAEYKSLEEVLRESDILSLHFSAKAGFGFIDKEKLSLLQNDTLIVNCGFTGAINGDDLYSELSSGRLRAFQDDPIDDRFNNLPIYNWNCSNMHTAYNTEEANRIASNMATKSIINLLITGKDKYKVN